MHRSQIGTGKVVVDARTLGIGDPLPAKLYLYLSKPQTKGSFASFGIFAVLDEAAPAVQGLGSLGTLKLVFATDLFNEPSAGRAVRLQDGAADRLGPADQRRRAQGPPRPGSPRRP